MSLAYRPSPVAAAFQALVGRIQPTARDASRFESHRTSIRNALCAGSGFDLKRLDPIGSFSRKTAVRRVSDADLLAQVNRASVSTGGTLQTSDTVLGKFRAVLSARFPHTAVGRDGQAVVVDFADGSHPVDVVPAIWVSQDGHKNYPIYLIPDGAGWWMRTSPTSHNRFIQDADARARGKLTYAAQLLKYWCWTRATPLPLSGFHLELRLAADGLCDGARSYATILDDAFALLVRRRCAAINDPLGISGHVAAASTEAKRALASMSVGTAAYHARRAVLAEARGHDAEALRQWNIVFHGRVGGAR